MTHTSHIHTAGTAARLALKAGAIGVSFLALAGLVTPAWALEKYQPTATVGAKCLVGWDGVPMTHTAADSKRMMEIAEHHDETAWQQMIKQGRITFTNAGVVVFVEYRDEETLTLQVRPQGDLNSIWIWMVGVKCPATEAKHHGK